jgi:hypothetical protein
MLLGVQKRLTQNRHIIRNARLADREQALNSRLKRDHVGGPHHG